MCKSVEEQKGLNCDKNKSHWNKMFIRVVLIPVGRHSHSPSSPQLKLEFAFLYKFSSATHRALGGKAPPCPLAPAGVIWGKSEFIWKVYCWFWSCPFLISWSPWAKVQFTPYLQEPKCNWLKVIFEYLCFENSCKSRSYSCLRHCQIGSFAISNKLLKE